MLESFQDSADRVRLNEDGTPRSKGFGFVEFSEHIHALAALRKLNNNPEFSMFAVGGASVRAKPCVQALGLAFHSPPPFHPSPFPLICLFHVGHHLQVDYTLHRSW